MQLPYCGQVLMMVFALVVLWLSSILGPDMKYAKDDISDEAFNALLEEVRSIPPVKGNLTVSSDYDECMDLPCPMSIWHNDLLISLTRYLGNDTWEALTENAEDIIVRDLHPLVVVVALSVIERQILRKQQENQSFSRGNG